MIWENIAFNQPVWTPYTYSELPASQAVDRDTLTSGHTGYGPMPFLAVDLGSNVPVGTVSLRLVMSKWSHVTPLTNRMYIKKDIDQ